MWMKWLPWRLIISDLAKKHGFVDPMSLVAAVGRIAQPSEVAAPVELLRLAAVLHARGLINSQIIQNNLDWIWPFWVGQQFDPSKKAFVPRAFSLTHINLTHRDWTSVGVPGIKAMPIIDPRGLVTPLYDGWSLDMWLFSENDDEIIPSREEKARQKFEMLDNVSVLTDVEKGKNYLTSRVDMVTDKKEAYCRMQISASTFGKGYLVVSVRPYNPEGISFIHRIDRTARGFMINRKDTVLVDEDPSGYLLSDYRRGDVFSRIPGNTSERYVKCDVGLCSGALIFDTEGQGSEKAITVTVPVCSLKGGREKGVKVSVEKWPDTLKEVSELDVPDEKIKDLYKAALRNLILMSPDTVYAGPYTYKEFWFRDAIYALNAMLSVGFHERSRKIIDKFSSYQTAAGYFRSQEGEWDSNGQVLWIMNRYCEMTGKTPPEEWINPAVKAMEWIYRKRVRGKREAEHNGLFPAGFSAEHFGPSDYYYWDNFWGVAGLKSGKDLLEMADAGHKYEDLDQEILSFEEAIETSIEKARKKMKIDTIPASPYRRMDSSAVGILVASYPLRIYGPDDIHIKNTVDSLMRKYFVNGLFFHEIAHSGINIYLSLNIAQVLLRSGDPRYLDIIEHVSCAASSTGHWPEAIHPVTGGGCMGDSQHLWASSEWILMLRNCFVREEKNSLILCSGIPEKWIESGQEMFFGPAPTSFGIVSVRLIPSDDNIKLELDPVWRNEPDIIEARIPGCATVKLEPGQISAHIKRK